MNEHILNFLEKLDKDDSLKQQFVNKSLKEKYLIAKQNSDGKFTEEEFTKAMLEILKNSKAETENEESSNLIDENSLENVSGGGIKDKLRMLDMLSLENVGDDVEAFGKMKPKHTAELIEAVDDLINGGAMLARSIYKVGHQFKESQKREELERRQKVSNALEQKLAEKGISFDEWLKERNINKPS